MSSDHSNDDEDSSLKAVEVNRNNSKAKILRKMMRPVQDPHNDQTKPQHQHKPIISAVTISTSLRMIALSTFVPDAIIDEIKNVAASAQQNQERFAVQLHVVSEMVAAASAKKPSQQQQQQQLSGSPQQALHRDNTAVFSPANGDAKKKSKDATSQESEEDDENDDDDHHSLYIEDDGLFGRLSTECIKTNYVISSSHQLKTPPSNENHNNSNINNSGNNNNNMQQQSPSAVLNTLYYHEGFFVSALEFSQNERYLVSATKDACIGVFDLGKRNLIRKFSTLPLSPAINRSALSLPSSSSAIFSISFSPCSSKTKKIDSFVVAGADGVVKWYFIDDLVKGRNHRRQSTDSKTTGGKTMSQKRGSFFENNLVAITESKNNNLKDGDRNDDHQPVHSHDKSDDYVAPHHTINHNRLPISAIAFSNDNFSELLGGSGGAASNQNNNNNGNSSRSSVKKFYLATSTFSLHDGGISTVRIFEYDPQETSKVALRSLVQLPKDSSAVLSLAFNYFAGPASSADDENNNDQQGMMNKSNTTNSLSSSSSSSAKPRLLLAVATRDGTVRILDVNHHGRVLHSLKNTHHGLRVNHISFFDPRVSSSMMIMSQQQQQRQQQQQQHVSFPITPVSPFGTNQGQSMMASLVMNQQTSYLHEVHDLLGCAGQDGSVRIYDALHGNLLYTLGREKHLAMHRSLGVFANNNNTTDIRSRVIAKKGFNALVQKMDTVKQRRLMAMAPATKKDDSEITTSTRVRTTPAANASLRSFPVHNSGNQQQQRATSPPVVNTINASLVASFSRSLRLTNNPLITSLPQNNHRQSESISQQSLGDDGVKFHRTSEVLSSSPTAAAAGRASTPTHQTSNNNKKASPSQSAELDNNSKKRSGVPNSSKNTADDETLFTNCPGILSLRFSAASSIQQSSSSFSTPSLHLLYMDGFGNYHLQRSVEELPAFPFSSVIHSLRRRSIDSKLLSFTAPNYIMLQDRKNRFLPQHQRVATTSPQQFRNQQQSHSLQNAQRGSMVMNSSTNNNRRSGILNNNNDSQHNINNTNNNPNTNIIAGRRFFEDHQVPIRHLTMVTSLPGNRNRYEQVAPLRSGQYGAVCVVRKIGGGGGASASLQNTGTHNGGTISGGATNKQQIPQITLRSEQNRKPSVAAPGTSADTNNSSSNNNNNNSRSPASGGGFGSSSFTNHTAEPLYVQKTMSLNSTNVVCTRSDADVLSNVAYPFIVQYIEQYEGFGNLNLIMEFVDGSDLHKKLDHYQENYPKGHPAVKAVAKIMKQQEQQNGSNTNMNSNTSGRTSVDNTSMTSESGPINSAWESAISTQINAYSYPNQQQQQSGILSSGLSQQSMTPTNSLSVSSQQNHSTTDIFASSMSKEEVISIFTQTALAVDFLHRNHIVHRDIKAANIIISRAEGIVKLTDFGFASRVGEVVLNDSRGTPKYSSPEIFLQLPHDAKTDCFSMGVLLYVLLTSGREYPFAGDKAVELAKSIVDDEPTPFNREIAPFVDRPLEFLVNKLLKKNAKKRMTMTAALQVLEKSYGSVSAAIRRYERLFDSQSGSSNSNNSMIARHLTKEQHEYLVSGLKKHKELILANH